MRDIDCVDDKELDLLMSAGVKAIDIRTPKEWKNTGIIKDSIKLMFFDEYGNYNAENWIKELEKYVKNKNETFVLICAHANRTKVLGSFLRDTIGYKKVVELCGGIEYGWILKERKTVEA